MLHAFLYSNPEVRDQIVFAPPELMNSPRASFIQQMVRAAFADPHARLQAVLDRVAEVLSADGPPVEAAHRAVAIRSFIAQIYRATLRREVDDYGLDHFEPIFAHLGFEAAARFLVDQLLKSEEYAGARLAPVLEAAAPTPPLLELRRSSGRLGGRHGS